MATLATRAWGSLVILIVVIALLILLCAGTTDYWQAWVYLALLAGLSGWITQDLLQRDQALLERRMKGGPTADPRPRQRIIMAGASIGFFVNAGHHLFHRTPVEPHETQSSSARRLKERCESVLGLCAVVVRRRGRTPGASFVS